MNERYKELLTESGLDCAALDRMGIMSVVETAVIRILNECMTVIDPTDVECDMVEESVRYKCMLLIDQHFNQ